ncbi:hypothetical protein ElyMa_000609200 [Elysia marginata]|uniref:Uncharacterized protein n=1 Tax=Elysia marginata TaxID=1093978 RepID=A0AAV4G7Q5_9GAST|nr:hypothetical protein ElyMa_000609200 [Elysia marginata]
MEAAFTSCKAALAEATRLHHPKLDTQISVITDASDHSVRDSDSTQFNSSNVILELIRAADEENDKNSIACFTQWCDDHFFRLNIKKTKELITYFRQHKKNNTLPIYTKMEK